MHVCPTVILIMGYKKVLYVETLSYLWYISFTKNVKEKKVTKKKCQDQLATELNVLNEIIEIHPNIQEIECHILKPVSKMTRYC